MTISEGFGMFLFVMKTTHSNIPKTTSPCTYVLFFGFKDGTYTKVIGHTRGSLKTRVNAYRSEFKRLLKKEVKFAHAALAHEFDSWNGGGDRAKSFETFLIDLLDAKEDPSFKNKVGGRDVLKYGEAEQFFRIVTRTKLAKLRI